jgi:hypothetical protein
VEPVDLRITTNTMDAVVNYHSFANWNASPEEYKKKPFSNNEKVLDILVTLVMLVFQKD